MGCVLVNQTNAYDGSNLGKKFHIKSLVHLEKKKALVNQLLTEKNANQPELCEEHLTLLTLAARDILDAR